MMKRDDQEYDHHAKTQCPSRRQRNACNVLCDKNAERIDAGTGPTDAVGNPDHAHGNNGVHPHGETHCYDDGDERDVLLAHTDGERTNAEQQQASGNQHPGCLSKPLDGTVQCCIYGAGLAQHCDYATDQEDEKNNTLRRCEAVGHSHQEMPGRQGYALFRTQCRVGSIDDDHSVRLVRYRDSLKLAVRYNIGQ